MIIANSVYAIRLEHEISLCWQIDGASEAYSSILVIYLLASLHPWTALGWVHLVQGTPQVQPEIQHHLDLYSPWSSSLEGSCHRYPTQAGCSAEDRKESCCRIPLRRGRGRVFRSRIHPLWCVWCWDSDSIPPLGCIQPVVCAAWEIEESFTVNL